MITTQECTYWIKHANIIWKDISTCINKSKLPKPTILLPILPNWTKNIVFTKLNHSCHFHLFLTQSTTKHLSELLSYTHSDTNTSTHMPKIKHNTTFKAWCTRCSRFISQNTTIECILYNTFKLWFGQIWKFQVLEYLYQKGFFLSYQTKTSYHLLHLKNTSISIIFST